MARAAVSARLGCEERRLSIWDRYSKVRANSRYMSPSAMVVVRQRPIQVKVGSPTHRSVSAAMSPRSKGGSSVNTNDVPDFDLEGIFKDLALRDYDRAVELARGFQCEGPRAVATIAIARAILEPKRR